MVCPTGPGGFVFKYWFAQRVWRGSVFFQWSAQRARGDSFLSTGSPNGSRFFKYWPAKGPGIFGLVLVCPTGLGIGVGFFKFWFAQQVWRGFGFFFQWSAQRAWGGFVFKYWFAQRVRGVRFLISGLLNGS